MQHTEKYQFNLIEGGDDFSPTPLNQNMEKVEAQLGAHAASLTSLFSAVGSGGKNARIAYGSYTGNGKFGSGNPNRLSFDFCPAVVIMGCGEKSSNSTWPTVFFRGLNVTHSNNGSTLPVTWTANGLSWYGDSASGQDNYANYVYYYVALGYSES